MVDSTTVVVKPATVVPVQPKLNPSTSYGSGRRTFRSLVGQEMVDIYVGSEEVHFRVHKHVLCERVPFFSKMFKSGFREAVENVARLPEDDPDSFDMLMDWIYFYTIRGLATMKDSVGTDIIIWDPVNFYSLAEKLCLPIVADNIMDILRRHHRKERELPSTDFVYRAYEATSHGSPLQRYCLLSTQYILSEVETTESENGWPTAEIHRLFKDHDTFASDFVDAIRGDEPSDPRHLPKCTFHFHGDNEPCISNDWNGKRKYYAPPQPGSSKKRPREETPP